MVQIKLRGVVGVESPSPRSFWCGLQHTATHTAAHCNSHCSTLQHTEIHCNLLQQGFQRGSASYWCHAIAHCNSHCNILLHAATHCNTLQHTATHCHTQHDHGYFGAIGLTLHHTATRKKADFREPSVPHCTRCNVMQHTVTHSLQHTATHCNRDACGFP